MLDFRDSILEIQPPYSPFLPWHPPLTNWLICIDLLVRESYPERDGFPDPVYKPSLCTATLAQVPTGTWPKEREGRNSLVVGVSDTESPHHLPSRQVREGYLPPFTCLFVLPFLSPLMVLSGHEGQVFETNCVLCSFLLPSWIHPKGSRKRRVPPVSYFLFMIDLGVPLQKGVATQAALTPEGPNIEKIAYLKCAVPLENFILAWKFNLDLQNSPQTRPWWAVRLKFAFLLEGFHPGGRSWNGSSFGPFSEESLIRLKFLGHVLRAILSLQPKCSHRCVSLKESP